MGRCAFLFGTNNGRRVENVIGKIQIIKIQDIIDNIRSSLDKSKHTISKHIKTFSKGHKNKPRQLECSVIVWKGRGQHTAIKLVVAIKITSWG